MNNKTDGGEITNKNENKKTARKKTVVKKQVNKEITAKKFEGLDGKFLLVNVGSYSNPANDVDIKDIEEKLTALLKENNVECLAFVTHHAVEMKIIEKLM